MSALAVLAPREASMFARLAEATVAPGDGLPSVAATDTVAFLDRYLAATPGLNRFALRVALHALELGPLALGYRHTLHRLPRPQRAEYLDRVEVGPASLALRPLTALAKLAYYGDDGVAGALGYDPDAVVARGRELRRTEARW